MDVATTTRPSAPTGVDALPLDAVAAYRRDGYAVLPGLFSARMLEATRAALSDLTQQRIPLTDSNVYFEPGHDGSAMSGEERELRVRKLDTFCVDSRAMMVAAMYRPLHAALDRIMGVGRTLFQEMALIKPPRIGGAKKWHQDASYFRVKDPRLVFGVWIALDDATLDNGCMQMARRSHLAGPAPHHHEGEVNECEIRADRQQLGDVVALPMRAGDALVFHGLVHHYTAPNTTGGRRRALQFHYCQLGAEWGTLEDHRRSYCNEDGSYAGCTLTDPPLPDRTLQIMSGRKQKPVTPMDEADL